MDELEISGKRYISTRRAGKENGYHSDYIGQLIRGGKVIGQKVGRAWYVDEQSLAQYLGKESAGPAPEQPKTVLKEEAAPVAQDRVVDVPAAASVAQPVEPQKDIAVEETPAPSPTPVEPTPAPVQTEVREQQTSMPPNEQASTQTDTTPAVAVDDAEEEISITVHTPQRASIDTEPTTMPEPAPVPAGAMLHNLHAVRARQQLQSSNALRYISDDEPLLPEIAPKKEVSRDIDVPISDAAAPTPSPLGMQRSYKGMAVLAAGGLIAVALSAAATMYVSSTVSVQGNTASASYSVELSQ